MAQSHPENDKLGYEQPTASDHRLAIRQAIGSKAGGSLPLRQYECLAAYGELADEPLDSDVSVGEARYRLVEIVGAEDRDPFDSANPYTRDELAAIREALDDE